MNLWIWGKEFGSNVAGGQCCSLANDGWLSTTTFPIIWIKFMWSTPPSLLPNDEGRRSPLSVNTGIGHISRLSWVALVDALEVSNCATSEVSAAEHQLDLDDWAWWSISGARHVFSNQHPNSHSLQVVLEALDNWDGNGTSIHGQG